MEWTFSVNDVQTGKVKYTLGQFRDDLKEEITAQHKVGGGDAELLFRLVYDVCYWLATESSLENLIAFYGGSMMDMNMLEIIAGQNQKNIDMLKAIIKCNYIAGIDAGLTQAEALKLLATR
ncbi:MAG: hypothetical protein OEX83_08900 [Gammaproteobacteria bacterium]|nr:hypothetical protein [Gammaproteobacteria bacterium]